MNSGLTAFQNPDKLTKCDTAKITGQLSHFTRYS